jgi:hypothetical protein
MEEIYNRRVELARRIEPSSPPAVEEAPFPVLSLGELFARRFVLKRKKKGPK